MKIGDLQTGDRFVLLSTLKDFKITDTSIKAYRVVEIDYQSGCKSSKKGLLHPDGTVTFLEGSHLDEDVIHLNFL